MVGIETRYCKHCGAEYKHCDLDDNRFDRYCPPHQRDMWTAYNAEDSL